MGTNFFFIVRQFLLLFKVLHYKLTIVEERKDLETVVSLHGGIYSSSLEFGRTTHLIALAPVGQKYKYAKLWELPVVHPRWIQDCITSMGISLY